MKPFDILVIGGGAAGFFGAITAAEAAPGCKVAILEKGKTVLQKVKVSGGGRCNLTHACFDPSELVQFYPRGSRELLGPFHTFAPGDTLEWFEKRGVPTKIEEDGRIFPVSDQSQSVIDCLSKEVKRLGIRLFTKHNAIRIVPPNESVPNWIVHTANQQSFSAPICMIASGGTPSMWKHLKTLGLNIVPPVPSLFTFNIKDIRVSGLEGLSIPEIGVKISKEKLESRGPGLITHWGLSGPGILRLSAWGARQLHSLDYKFPLEINWLGATSPRTISQLLQQLKMSQARRLVSSPVSLDIPNRLWSNLVKHSEIPPEKRWADLSRRDMENLARVLAKSQLQVDGKSTYKEEFVTAGGISLKEINFKYFESKRFPNLFFAGEVLDIDAITGGFNFQAAWTGGWIAGEAMGRRLRE